MLEPGGRGAGAWRRPLQCLNFRRSLPSLHRGKRITIHSDQRGFELVHWLIDIASIYSRRALKSTRRDGGPGFSYFCLIFWGFIVIYRFFLFFYLFPSPRLWVVPFSCLAFEISKFLCFLAVFIFLFYFFIGAGGIFRVLSFFLFFSRLDFYVVTFHVLQ